MIIWWMTTHHQSHISLCWLKMVPLGQRKEDLQGFLRTRNQLWYPAPAQTPPSSCANVIRLQKRKMGAETWSTRNICIELLQRIILCYVSHFSVFQSGHLEHSAQIDLWPNHKPKRWSLIAAGAAFEIISTTGLVGGVAPQRSIKLKLGSSSSSGAKQKDDCKM